MRLLCRIARIDRGKAGRRDIRKNHAQIAFRIICRINASTRRFSFGNEIREPEVPSH
jgi:hypothetical protein